MISPIRRTPAMDQAIINFWLILLSDPLENRAAAIFGDAKGRTSPLERLATDMLNEDAQSARYLSSAEQERFRDCFMNVLEAFPEGMIRRPTGEIINTKDGPRQPVEVIGLTDIKGDYGIPKIIKLILNEIGIEDTSDFRIPKKSGTTYDEFSGTVIGTINYESVILHAADPAQQLSKMVTLYEQNGVQVDAKRRHVLMMRIRDRTDSINPACSYQKDTYTNDYNADDFQQSLLKDAKRAVSKGLVPDESGLAVILERLTTLLAPLERVETGKTAPHRYDFISGDQIAFGTYEAPIYEDRSKETKALAAFLLDSTEQIRASNASDVAKWEIMSSVLGAAHYVMKFAVPPRHLSNLDGETFAELQERFAFKSPADFGINDPAASPPSPTRDGGGGPMPGRKHFEICFNYA